MDSKCSILVDMRSSDANKQTKIEKKKKKIDCDMRHTVRGFSIESCKHAMRHMVREFLTKPNTLLLDSFVCCMPKNQLIL